MKGIWCLMMEKIDYVQMKIYKQFQCDGSKCNSMCCRGWLINIDETTLEKYHKLGFDSFIKYDEDLKQHVFILKDGSCPMLGDDGLCKIQKKHGEDFLSYTCKNFPRRIQDFGDVFFERMLDFACPVAADLILKQKQPVEFEIVSDYSIHANMYVGFDLTPLQLNDIFQLQIAVTKILQNRRMTIDQRFLTLGFFFSEVGDLRFNDKSAENLSNDINMLQELCTSEKFFEEDLPEFCKAIKFNSHEFIRMMINFVETVFGSDSSFVAGRVLMQKYFASHDKILGIEPDPSGNTQLSITKIAEKYLELDNIRDRILKDFSHVIENYLVNEFWLQVYPYRFVDVSSLQNYYMFVILYKIQEFFIVFHLEDLRREQGYLNDSQIETELVEMFKLFDHMMIHCVEFFNELPKVAKNKGDNISAMMKSMLRV